MKRGRPRKNRSPKSSYSKGYYAMGRRMKYKKMEELRGIRILLILAAIGMLVATLWNAQT